MSSLCPSLTWSLTTEQGHKRLQTQKAEYKLNNTVPHRRFQFWAVADSSFFHVFSILNPVFFSRKHLFVVSHEYKRRKTLRHECHAFLFFYILPIFFFTLLQNSRPPSRLQFPWYLWKLNVRRYVCVSIPVYDVVCACMCVLCGKLFNSLKLGNSSSPTFMKFNEPKKCKEDIFGDVPATSWD